MAYVLMNICIKCLLNVMKQCFIFLIKIMFEWPWIEHEPWVWMNELEMPPMN